ncbi:Kinesin-like protein KIF22-A [Morella rubra]|uniref:Kinesin-like protein KIF22-A n=1 Tax=Morella rubra TaxID=262757 RepID=A0A6A1WJS9_9ROSI|nr:Kinesin-like protein KIF22-A [Morella rubra]
MGPNSISKVRVIVRVRPFLPHEIFDKNGDRTPCVSVLDQDSESGQDVAVYLKDKDTSSGNECHRYSFLAKRTIIWGTDEQQGLMPLAMPKILSLSQSTGSTAEISYYEVYMDRCCDLLGLKPKEIAVLDDKDGKIHLRGLSRVPVKSMSEFHEALSCGVERRKVAHTGLNDVSSRSHGVLVISVSTPCGDGSGTVVSGKLNLIDLAGYFHTFHG